MTVCRGCAGLMEDTGEDWGVCQTCNPTAPVRTQISIRISPKDNDLLKSLSVKLQCSQAEVVSRALNSYYAIKNLGWEKVKLLPHDVLKDCYLKHSEELKDCLNYDHGQVACQVCYCKRGPK